MSGAPLVVEASSEPLERIRADVAVVGFAPEDRPLRAAAGRADWRLCGRLSELIASGRLTGARGDAALLAGGAGLRSPLLLALGIGPRAQLDRATWRAVGRDAIARVVKLGAGCAALGIVPEGPDVGGLRSFLQGATPPTGTQPLRLLLPDPPASDWMEALRLDSLPAGVELRFAASSPSVAPRPVRHSAGTGYLHLSPTASVK